MNTENQKPETEPSGLWSNKKSRLLIILMVIGGLIAALVLFFPRSAAEPTIEKKEPLFHRDEPVKEQIFQGDYKEKVREMLDSGKSVMQISKETGIRIDVVRKIKKQKAEEE